MMHRRIRAVVTAVVLAAAAAVALPAQPAAATVSVNTVAGWNMQGASSGGGNPNDPPSSNWVDQVLGMMNRYSVVTLQEAGAVPASARPTGRPLPGTAAVAGYAVVEYLWNRRFVYHVQVGGAGTRTNMAIVTRTQAQSVFMIPPQGARGAGRPSFGVEVQDTDGTANTSVYWNVHAQSFGAAGALRNDAANIVAQIDFVMRGVGSPSWAAIGDWNRDPATQLLPMVPLTLRVVFTGEATHFGSTQDSELDAMVTNDGALALRAVRAGGPLSDHSPIYFSTT